MIAVRLTLVLSRDGIYFTLLHLLRFEQRSSAVLHHCFCLHKLLGQ
jgi:hypothetical protein